METAKRQERKMQQKQSHSRVLISILLIIVVLAAGGLFFAKQKIDKILNKDTFYAGISIDGISLQDKTREEVVNALEDANQARLDSIHINLKYNDQQWNFGYKDIGATLNIEDEVNKAYQIGRQGNFLERLKEIQSLEKNPYQTKTTISYNLDLIKPKLAEVKKKIDQEPVDASVTFKPSASNKFSFTSEKKGFLLDVNNVYKDIEEQLSHQWNVTLLLEPKTVEPKVFRADLEKATKQVAHFSTNLGNSSASRRHNIQKAIGEFNGLMIMPDQEISFNETTGPRSLDKGYENAPVIKADKSLEDGPGGGVCQASTTLYNASLLAGLTITQRAHHSFPSHYVDKGFDATVNWPNLDLKIKNNRKTPVFIQSYVSGNNVHVIIYGEPLPNGRTIRLSSQVYQTIKAPTPSIVKDTAGKYVKYTDEKFVKVESRTGYRVRTYRTILENGKVVSKDLVATDYYQPIKGTTYVGVQTRPAPAEPKTEPSDN